MMDFITRPVIALILFVITISLAPLNDALVKLMSDRFSVFEILGVRAACSCAILAVIPATWHSLSHLQFRTFLILCFRGFCLVGAMLFFFLPLSVLSLAEVTAIFYTSPLMISLFSVPVLGERLGIYRSMAIVAGLVGAIIIIQPGGQNFQLAYIMPLFSALSYASYQLVTRYMKNQANLMAMVTVQNIVYLFAGFAGVAVIAMVNPSAPAAGVLGFLMRPWNTPAFWDFFLLAVTGVLVLSLSFGSTNAYRNVEATIAAPFEYTALPMAILWGIIIWGEWPAPSAWAGITLILSAGLFMIYRENVRNRTVVSSTPLRSGATTMLSAEEAEAAREYESVPIPF